MLPGLRIRLLASEDPPVISAPFGALGWVKPPPPSQYERYLREQAARERVVLVATGEDALAGYLTIKGQPPYEPFRSEGIPEVTDLNVLPALRRQGIASALADEAGARVVAVSPLIGIGVGMYPDYSPAQRMYVVRGCIPAGRVTSDRRHLQWGEPVRVDDDVVLFLTKRLVHSLTHTTRRFWRRPAEGAASSRTPGPRG